MNAVFYVNAPLKKEEHDKLAAMAKLAGRSKGQQLRYLLLPSLTTPTQRPNAATVADMRNSTEGIPST